MIDLQTEPFYKSYKSLMRNKDLSLTDKTILCLLMSYDKTSIHKIKQSTISNELGLGISTVKRSIQSLKEKELIDLQSDRQNKVHTYIINWNKMETFFNIKETKSKLTPTDNNTTTDNDIPATDNRTTEPEMRIALTDEHYEYWLEYKTKYSEERLNEIKTELVAAIKYQEEKNIPYDEMKCLYQVPSIAQIHLEWAFQITLKHYLEEKTDNDCAKK